MSDDNMQAMMSLMLAEMREMRSDIGEYENEWHQRVENLKLESTRYSIYCTD